MPIDHNHAKNTSKMQPIILIPARMASTRLPNKPMAQIGDAAMIVQCWRRAVESEVARVVVACDAHEIKEAVEQAGGEAVLTDPDLPSGSDRIWQALERVDPKGEHDYVVNLQGDMPTLDPTVIRHVLEPLQNEAVDIATLAAEIDNEEDKHNPAVVKIAMGELMEPIGNVGGGREASRLSPAVGAAVRPIGRAAGEHGGNQSIEASRILQGHIKRALYFSRATIPANDGPLYHHIGIYAYRRDALQRFVLLPPSPLEQREKLEQLRALEAGMRIDVAVVDTVPLGVDTPEQLEQARALIG